MIETTTYLDDAAKDYDRIETAIRFLEENFRQQPSLEEVAAVVGLSEYHFHRLFGRWVGTTPKRFLQFLTAEYAKERLAESASVLDAAYDAGLSGSGRLHDLMVNLEAISPGEYKRGGSGLVISYGIHTEPFWCLPVGGHRTGDLWSRVSGRPHRQADTGRSGGAVAGCRPAAGPHADGPLPRASLPARRGAERSSNHPAGQGHQFPAQCLAGAAADSRW